MIKISGASTGRAVAALSMSPIYTPGMRDIDTIDSELALVATLRRA